MREFRAHWRSFLFFVCVAVISLFSSCAGGASGNSGDGRYATLRLGVGTGSRGRFADSGRFSLFANGTVTVTLSSTDGEYSDSSSTSLDSDGKGVISVKQVPVGKTIKATALVSVDGNTWYGENSVNITEGDNSLVITVELSGDVLNIPANSSVEYIDKLFNEKIKDGNTYTLKLKDLNSNLMVSMATRLNCRFNLDLTGVTATLLSTVFKGLRNIVSVDMSGSAITSIDSSAFDGCTALEKVKLPFGVTELKSSTFYGCSALTDVTLPDNLSIIGMACFQDCTSLTTLNLPSGVTDIRTSVFSGSGLTSIEIPQSVTNLNTGAFNMASNLTHVTVYTDCSADLNSALASCSSITSVKVKNSVSNGTLSSGSLQWCPGITSLEIDSSIKNIDANFFSPFTSLTSLTSNGSWINPSSGMTYTLNSDATYFGYGFASSMPVTGLNFALTRN